MRKTARRIGAEVLVWLTLAVAGCGGRSWIGALTAERVATGAQRDRCRWECGKAAMAARAGDAGTTASPERAATLEPGVRCRWAAQSGPAALQSVAGAAGPAGRARSGRVGRQHADDPRSLSARRARRRASAPPHFCRRRLLQQRLRRALPLLCARRFRSGAACRRRQERSSPRAICTAEATTTCGRSGRCDGAGACQRYPTGTICAARPASADIWTPVRHVRRAGKLPHAPGRELRALRLQRISRAVRFGCPARDSMCLEGPTAPATSRTSLRGRIRASRAAATTSASRSPASAAPAAAPAAADAERLRALHLPRGWPLLPYRLSRCRRCRAAGNTAGGESPISSALSARENSMSSSMRPGNSSVGTPLASLPLPPRMTGVVSGAKVPVSGALATRRRRRRAGPRRRPTRPPGGPRCPVGRDPVRRVTRTRPRW